MVSHGLPIRREAAPRGAFLHLLSIALFACGGGGSGGGNGVLPDFTLEAAFAGLDFSRPVKLVQHPVDDDRWYAVEQGGKIKTFLASDPAGTLLTAVDLVASPGINLGDTGGEQGLLGLAFDPDFATNGELYITYTDETAQKSMLARYQSPDADGPFTPTAPDPIVLAIPHNASSHNAGDIIFGPDDDLLYYSMGDGANSSTAQNTSALLGKVLRLDVRGTPAAGETYAVPPTNPFSAVGRPFCDAAGVSPAVPAQPCPEVYAYGFRNPWRMSFDLDTGDLWLGDVGESKQEEIDLVLSGRNYGWDCKEGELDNNTGAGCTGLTFEPPVVVHNRDFARSITGGVVYRGSLIPELDGFYLYGDFSLQRFYAFDVGSMGDPIPLGLPAKAVTAFGQGRDGEVYVVSFDSPSIYRLVPAP